MIYEETTKEKKKKKKKKNLFIFHCDENKSAFVLQNNTQLHKNKIVMKTKQAPRC